MLENGVQIQCYGIQYVNFGCNNGFRDENSITDRYPFEQILSMVKQLPRQQKISKVLEKEVVDSKLQQLLTTFKTNDLDAKVDML